MTRLLRGLVPALLIAAPAAALASSGRASRVLVTDCTHARFKPQKLILACGDGSAYLAKLKWSSWTHRRASGTGSFEQISCTPSCAQGHLKRYPAKVTLTAPRRCPHQSHKLFNKLTVTYTRQRPARTAKTVRYTLGCPF